MLHPQRVGPEAGDELIGGSVVLISVLLAAYPDIRWVWLTGLMGPTLSSSHSPGSAPWRCSWEHWACPQGPASLGSISEAGATIGRYGGDLRFIAGRCRSLATKRHLGHLRRFRLIKRVTTDRLRLNTRGSPHSGQKSPWRTSYVSLAILSKPRTSCVKHIARNKRSAIPGKPHEKHQPTGSSVAHSYHLDRFSRGLVFTWCGGPGLCGV
jgi:hypothetical protein